MAIAYENLTDSTTGAPDLLQDITDLLASFSSKESAAAEKSKEHRKTPRFRVNWHTDILIEGQGTLHGSINDLSTQGASVYLNNNLPTIKCTLHIHVPPLDSTSKPHLIAISGKVAYTVYDGKKQSFRTAINFLGFNLKSDLALLGGRLSRHHLEIHEF